MVELPHPHIRKIAVLQRKPGKEDALKLLKDIAHRVSLLMRENGFKVTTLVEFYPRDRSLLGMNVNHGQKIMLRLRDPLDEFRFLPWESLMGTMLHELTHNVFGPHDQRFYSKLDDLSARQWCIDQLGLKDNFLGEGVKLGSAPNTRRGNPSTVQRGGKVNKRPGKGTRLGTLLGDDNVLRNTIRRLKPSQLAAMAAEQRNEADKKWCVEDNKDANIPDDDTLDIVVLDDDQPDTHDIPRVHSAPIIIEDETTNDGQTSRYNDVVTNKTDEDNDSVEIIDLTSDI
ncbi:DNA-dependent metalloprotease WSS1 [Nakaseomyces bracarensis]|uniref:DNA-dependent metalloprotease WSS1 n=1 Tax=Nakaseomyces bracarensis TaxID=273131 RepID=A0ABR4NN43_9SACH